MPEPHEIVAKMPSEEPPKWAMDRALTRVTFNLAVSPEDQQKATARDYVAVREKALEEAAQVLEQKQLKECRCGRSGRPSSHHPIMQCPVPIIERCVASVRSLKSQEPRHDPAE